MLGIEELKHCLFRGFVNARRLEMQWDAIEEGLDRICRRCDLLSGCWVKRMRSASRHFEVEQGECSMIELGCIVLTAKQTRF